MLFITGHLQSGKEGKFLEFLKITMKIYRIQGNTAEQN